MMGDEKKKESDGNDNERVRAWICDWRAGCSWEIWNWAPCEFVVSEVLVANRWRLGRGKLWRRVA